ncbi:putative Ammonium transporter Rh type B-B [Paratrimastix pyriformis]|uniref:Ammonium transporter Rh type B-B n=1 Tax=Paratrimastix pyriformis TaxID=342808 RepID=A0ABQ8UTR1_9EUKA|nr:putative Ammonium transporter Rh type B-B [Paratrimastix pyriformis]
MGHSSTSLRSFALLYLFFQVILAVLFGFFTQYAESTSLEQDTKFYQPLLNVVVMIFIGFGFLMTFLSRYGYSALSYTYLLACFTLQWAVLTNHFFRCMFDERGPIFMLVPVSFVALLEAAFCSGAVMISLGAVLGKLSPVQLLLMTAIEVPLFSVVLGLLERLDVSDIGGSMGVHTFGAYFGLAVMWMQTKGASAKPLRNAIALDGSAWKARYDSDVSAMSGTLWLWVYWPSFVAAMCPPTHFARSVVNTFLALAASGGSVFVYSALFRHGHRPSAVGSTAPSDVTAGIMLVPTRAPKHPGDMRPRGCKQLTLV